MTGLANHTNTVQEASFVVVDMTNDRRFKRLILRPRAISDITQAGCLARTHANHARE
jgi:hypothetical protein